MEEDNMGYASKKCVVCGKKFLNGVPKQFIDDFPDTCEECVEE